MSTDLNWFKSSYSGSQGGECIEVAVEWRKSSYSGDQGECVEVAAEWRKSSYSSDRGGACVEVATHPTAVHIRDSKDTTRPALTVSPSAWGDFLDFAVVNA